MVTHMVNFESIFSEVGRIWDQTGPIPSTQIQSLQDMKERIRSSDIAIFSDQRREVLLELIDLTFQFTSGEDIIDSDSKPSLSKCGVFSQSSTPMRKTPFRNRKCAFTTNEDTIRSISRFSLALSQSTEASISKQGTERICSTTWKDIVGQEEAKQALYEACILSSLLPSALFVGCRQLCSSILLCGPPGTGKTSLVQAAAYESNYQLFELSPSECLSKWSGESERRIRDLFIRAKQQAPCILFFDEMDGLMSRRESEETSNRRVLSELLIQLSSIRQEDRVIFIGTTNRLGDIDPAILRRFNKILTVHLPSLQDRYEIIQQYLAPFDSALSTEELSSLAQSTEGWSGSLLYNLCREASLAPVLEYADAVLRSTLPNRSSETSLIRPIAFRDFIGALEQLQQRSELEAIHCCVAFKKHENSHSYIN